LIWQLNDCWPAQSWAVIDSEGEYKAAAYELRRLHAPLLLSLEREATKVRLWAVLDNTLEPFSGKVVLEARSLVTGDVFRHWTAEVALAPGERRVVIEAQISGLVAHETLLAAACQGARATALLSEPKDVALPLSELRLVPTQLAVVVESDGPVVDLFVWDQDGGAIFEDNFVTLPGPGRVSLRIRGVPGRLAARSLAGRHVLSDS
jgi:beta-mannosidase